ncbi:MAG: VOC family protein, partial [Candidatus Limnocylindria bacterium]
MRKRTGASWRTAAEHGRTLAGLTINLIVRDIARSLPFYTGALGCRVLYSDADYAALEREGVRLQLHADHAYEHMPWANALASGAPRGL